MSVAFCCNPKTINTEDNNIEKRDIEVTQTTEPNIILMKLKKGDDNVASHKFNASDDVTPENMIINEIKNSFDEQHQANESLNFIMKPEFDVQYNVTEDNEGEECLFLTNGKKIDLDDITDVWRTAYYRTSERLSCFKIHIKKTSAKDLKTIAQKYNDSNGRINWESCLLEIKTDDANDNIGRKHYLQTKNIDQGVFENIILVDDNLGGNSTPVVIEQSPDQWMVFQNLLLMRDCENGEVVVFTRVPHQPKLENVLNALKAFGEETFNGTLACIDEDRIERSVRNILRQVLGRLKVF
ncbi:uncharacterized protein LOC110385968 [Bombyx mori]|uniref:uncharacterized protein LOC110385968 n=1 Tax=Bombyx mori TaxID=7091 RepID=UPI002ED2C762